MIFDAQKRVCLLVFPEANIKVQNPLYLYSTRIDHSLPSAPPSNVHMAAKSPPNPPTREQILASPAMHAPSGVTLDFEHSWSMSYPALRILISVYVLSTIVFIVRIYERLRITRKFFVEDYMIILAWVRPDYNTQKL